MAVDEFESNAGSCRTSNWFCWSSESLITPVAVPPRLCTCQSPTLSRGHQEQSNRDTQHLLHPQRPSTTVHESRPSQDQFFEFQGAPVQAVIVDAVRVLTWRLVGVNMELEVPMSGYDVAPLLCPRQTTRPVTLQGLVWFASANVFPLDFVNLIL